MKTLITILFCLTTVFVVKYYITATHSTNETAGPRYTWVAFSSFWNKQAEKSIKIKKIRDTSDGYFVEFGPSNSMHVYQKSRIITHACVNYAGNDNNAGGLIFTKLKNKMINIGTFRWPINKISEVAQTFDIISKTEKYYSYMTSSFKLTHSDAAGWTFCLNFAQP